MSPSAPRPDRSGLPYRFAAVTVGLAVGLGTVATGCGSESTTNIIEDSTTTTATTSTPATPATGPPTTAPPTTEALVIVPGQITIRDYEFLPPSATVAAGETLTWQNTDDVDHWVLTEDTTTVDSGIMAPGQPFTATLATPGTYAYYCDIHNSMTGTFVVE